MNEKLWGGRFQSATDELANDFNSSIRFDSRLYRQDIEGSLAHAAMLARCKIISEGDAGRIKAALEDILADIEAGKIAFSVDAEDIHMNIETLLTERIADSGKRLHTARSRNDQVALDLRMYLKDEISAISDMLAALIGELLGVCGRHADTVMPGYTHLQRAQPITLAHHFLAYAEMFLRDIGRLADCRKRTDVMPLGSGALAGVTYPIDRQGVADALGFAAISQNSLDGVSDRDFVIELLSALSILMVHLSRSAEELILWSSLEFGFAEMDDAYSTGSSMMPQKKNPDVAELIRGKTGRVFGDLIALLTVMKGLPLSYNKDLQEDKEPVFDAVDTIKLCLPVYTRMLAATKFNAGAMRDAARGGFTNATDLADYLVRKGIPFRDAHEIVGKAVYYCIGQGKALEDVSLERLKSFSPAIEADVYGAIALETCVNARNVAGGPARAAVEASMASVKARLSELRGEPG
jgi:argininosuccinate lyase